MPIPPCVWAHVTQSDLVFNHLYRAPDELPGDTRGAASLCKDLQQQQQQHDETPPGIAPKMAAGLTRKQKSLLFAGGCGMQWEGVLSL